MDSSIRTTVNMATFPPRLVGLGRRIQELAGQCDVMRIYMNGYDAWPASVPRPDNVEYVLGTGELDKGSQGKLHWLDGEPGYYLTVDDDIIYPPDYVARLTEGCWRFYDRAIVSLHGQRFRIRDRQPAPLCKEARGARKMYHYSTYLGFDTPVHMVGNGIMCCRPSIIKLDSSVTKGPRNSGDDEDIALFAQHNRIPMLALRHKGDWVVPDRDMCRVQASFENREFLALQNAKLQTCRRWNLIDKPPQRTAV